MGRALIGRSTATSSSHSGGRPRVFPGRPFPPPPPPPFPPPPPAPIVVGPTAHFACGPRGRARAAIGADRPAALPAARRRQQVANARVNVQPAGGPATCCSSGRRRDSIRSDCSNKQTNKRASEPMGRSGRPDVYGPQQVAIEQPEDDNEKDRAPGPRSGALKGRGAERISLCARDGLLISFPSREPPAP